MSKKRVDSTISSSKKKVKKKKTENGIDARRLTQGWEPHLPSPETIDRLARLTGERGENSELEGVKTSEEERFRKLNQSVRERMQRYIQEANLEKLKREFDRHGWQLSNRRLASRMDKILRKYLDDPMDSSPAGEQSNNLGTDALVAHGFYATRERLSLAEIEPLDRVFCTIYLDSNKDDDIATMMESFSKFCEAFDFAEYEATDPIRGSWFQTRWQKFRKAMSGPEVRDRFKEIEYGLKTALVDEKVAKISREKAEAVKSLLDAIKSFKNAALFCHGLVVVKSTDENGDSDVRVQTLTHRQLMHLENHPELSRDPKLLHEYILEDTNQGQPEDTAHSAADEHPTTYLRTEEPRISLSMRSPKPKE